MDVQHVWFNAAPHVWCNAIGAPAIHHFIVTRYSTDDVRIAYELAWTPPTGRFVDHENAPKGHLTSRIDTYEGQLEDADRAAQWLSPDAALAWTSQRATGWLGESAPAADTEEHHVRAFIRALDEFVRAATKLERAWPSGDAFEATIEGYPDYLPSFDEFSHDVSAWRDTVKELQAQRRQRVA